MPVPELDANGVLPAGVFDCTLAEVAQRFGGFEEGDYFTLRQDELCSGPMESLKEFSEVLNADPRQEAFVLVNEKTGQMRRIGLKDYHDEAKQLVLHEGVPEKVRYHFENARNLLVYSWFHYPFNSLAQFHAYIAVEAALRLKAGKPKANFRMLLKEAVKKKWITDEGFTLGRARKSAQPVYPITIDGAQVPDARSYCEVLIQSIPNLRNTFAHGEVFLHNSGATSMLNCAELINQLFDKPLTGAVAAGI